jgi:N-acetylglutamate synthase-like GNAT family acetyltransferase
MLQGLARLPNGLSVRPARPSDKPFLRKLVDDKYSDLKETTNLSRDQLEHLMEVQLTAQNSGYGAMHPNALYFIIEKAGQSIGKLTLGQDGEGARIIDLGFVGKAQGKGYGQAVVLSILAACGQSKCPLTVTANVTNIALTAFLKQHGFEVADHQPGAGFALMRWTPTKEAMQS